MPAPGCRWLRDHAFRVVRLIVAVLLLLSTGCTTVMIQKDDGATSVERHFGWTSIRMSPTTQAMVAKVKSVGVLNSPMGLSVGAARMNIAALPMDCRLVVWLEQPQQVEELRAQLSDVKDVCIVNPDGKEPEP